MEKTLNYSYLVPVPLEKEQRAYVSTADAAFLLNRQPQTLHKWACLENGPIRPLRVHGRLAWSVAQIKKLLNGDT